jgi:uncharacterized membrane protein
VAVPPSSYRFRTIEPNSANSSAVDGINDRGQIVGTSPVILSAPPLGERGFLFSGRGFQILDFSGASGTDVSGINNQGDIVGGYYDDEGGLHGFMKLNEEDYASVDYPNANSTVVSGINNRGQVVGTFNITSTTIGMDDADSSTSVLQHGFLLSDGAFQTIDYPGANGTLLAGINRQGVVVGEYEDSSGAHHGFSARPQSTG